MSTPCSCIGGYFRLRGEAIDSAHLLITDLSDWQPGEPGAFVRPDTYTLELTRLAAGPTAAPVSVNVYAQMGQYLITAAEAPALFPLQDGVYQAELESCGIRYRSLLLLTPALTCCMDQAWSEDPARARSAELVHATAMLDAAVRAAELGNAPRASELYTQAQLACTPLPNSRC